MLEALVQNFNAPPKTKPASQDPHAKLQVKTSTAYTLSTTQQPTATTKPRFYNNSAFHISYSSCVTIMFYLGKRGLPDRTGSNWRQKRGIQAKVVRPLTLI